MNLNPTHLHHAYVILGDLKQGYQELRDFFDTEITGMQWIDYSYEKLGIDEVRDLREILTEQSGGRFVVISAERFPHEAQNAFLKLLEEPAPGIHIFIILPPQVTLLETIQSRVVTLDLSNDKKNLIFPIKEFLFSSFSERLDRIEALHKSRDQAFQAYEVHEFLDALESGLAILFHKKRTPAFRESFDAIVDARTWAKQTGFPMKNILEYVAIITLEFGKK